MVYFLSFANGLRKSQTASTAKALLGICNCMKRFKYE